MKKDIIKVGSIEQIPKLIIDMKKMYDYKGGTANLKELLLIKRELNKMKTTYEDDYDNRQIKYKIESDISKRYYLKMLEALHGYLFL